MGQRLTAETDRGAVTSDKAGSTTCKIENEDSRQQSVRLLTVESSTSRQASSALLWCRGGQVGDPLLQYVAILFRLVEQGGTLSL